MRTPEHFSNKGFTQYIYQCAIRDRISYLKSITPAFTEPDEQTKHEIEETKSEIKSMQERRDTAIKRAKKSN